jgi:hypothetical protein
MPARQRGTSARCPAKPRCPRRPPGGQLVAGAAEDPRVRRARPASRAKRRGRCDRLGRPLSPGLRRGPRDPRRCGGVGLEAAGADIGVERLVEGRTAVAHRERGGRTTEGRLLEARASRADTRQGGIETELPAGPAMKTAGRRFRVAAPSPRPGRVASVARHCRGSVPVRPCGPSGRVPRGGSAYGSPSARGRPRPFRGPSRRRAPGPRRPRRLPPSTCRVESAIGRGGTPAGRSPRR